MRSAKAQAGFALRHRERRASDASLSQVIHLLDYTQVQRRKPPVLRGSSSTVCHPLQLPDGRLSTGDHSGLHLTVSIRAPIAAG
jgi:hypothetical protein